MLLIFRDSSLAENRLVLIIFIIQGYGQNGHVHTDTNTNQSVFWLVFLSLLARE